MPGKGMAVLACMGTATCEKDYLVPGTKLAVAAVVTYSASRRNVKGAGAAVGIPSAIVYILIEVLYRWGGGDN